MNPKQMLFTALLFLVGSVSLQAQCVAGLTVATSDDRTEINLCEEDDIGTLRFRASSNPTPVSYVLTDAQNIIIDVQLNGVFDFSGLDPANYRVWAFSYAGNITAQPGQDAGATTLAGLCSELSANFVSINTEAIEGGTIAAEDSSTDCLFEGADKTRFSTSSAATNYAYVVTDENNVIIDLLPSNEATLFNYDGNIRIWGLAFTGDILAQVGDNAATTTLTSGCFDLSDNFLPYSDEDKTFTLQILHNNDGESQLINAGEGLEDIGGVARFKFVVDSLRMESADAGVASVLLSSGDNYLPGPEFNASLDLPADEPLYDAQVLNALGYDALAIGNHDFDFGPSILERLIEGATAGNDTKFLSANLDFSAEPGLQELMDNGQIAKRTVIERNGVKIGVFGLTTTDLPFISSPGGVEVDTALVEIANEQIAALQADGAEQIILISHLQGISQDTALAQALSDVDIIIAGGGDELLTNNPADTLPGLSVGGPYPLQITDAAGETVYVVTTAGEYRYLGQLIVRFNKNGEVVEVCEGSNPVVIDTDNADAGLQADVVDPVAEYVGDLAENVLAITEVDLNGVRQEVRTRETNEGNLIADALLWQSQELASSFGAPAPMVALQNGGGIRNNTIIPAGSEITELTTFDMLPFSNFVTVVEPLPAAQFKEILENCVSQVEGVSGRFTQVAGFEFVYDLGGTPQELDNDGNVLTAGTRVVSANLDDGTPIIQNGAVVAGAPDITVTTVNFLANGGDQYPFRGADFTSLGVTYQQALANYLVDVLSGVITADEYPVGGEGRILQVMNVEGGEIAAEDSADNCLAAGADVTSFTTTSTSMNYAYVVTDENNVIVDLLPANEANLFEYDGNIRVWGLAFAGDVLAQVGDDAAATQLASIAFDLSDNFLPYSDEDKTFTLQILHNNDGESQLINAGEGLEDIGGVARFKFVVDSLRMESADAGVASVLLSSGDNYLPGPEFNASLDLPADEPLYDAQVLNALGYDALAIGNHDFDFGPSILERLIEGATAGNDTKFLSANLDFSAEPGLQELMDNGQIAKRTVIERNGVKIGVFGLTTTDLPFISSPGGVEVDTALVEIANEQIAALQADGAEQIILISHLQGISQDTALAQALSDVDIIIAGGGDELLTNNPADTLPGLSVGGPYPLQITDAAGETVYVVTTAGEYRYLGQLIVRFNKNGEVVEVCEGSNPVVIDTDNADAGLQADVVDPVAEYVGDLAENVLAITEVDLNGVRQEVRTRETNEGNLIADALLWQSQELASSFGAPAPMVALQNGGGIRNNTIIPAGSEITELTTFDMLPFSNFVTVVEPLPAAQFKEILENCVSQVEGVSGRFTQVAGFEFVYDLGGTPQELDNDGNVLTAGTRVVSANLDDGTPIIQNGAVVAGAPDITVTTVNFLANGGDQYPFRGADFTSLGVTYQQALANYLVDVLSGVITADEYPVGGEGRITQVMNLIGGGMNSLSVSNAEMGAQYFPNPTTRELTVRFDMAFEGRAQLQLFNLNGQQVATVFDGLLDTGRQEVEYDLSGLASGQYVLLLRANGKQTAMKITKQ